MNEAESISGGKGPEYLSFDPVAQDYDASRGIPEQAIMQFAELIRDAAVLSPGRSMLDAGVGTGRLALPLARLGVSVIGVDISDGMLATLNAKRLQTQIEMGSSLPLRVTRGDLRHLPLKQGVVGAVLFVHILHLIVDWKTVLDEVRRVLAPGGILMFAGTGGQNSPARDHYNRLAREHGLLSKSLGAYLEEVLAYLALQGLHATQIDTSRITWIARRPLAVTLDMLRRRTWSSLWNISDADNETLLEEVTDWALQHYGSLDAIEESEGGCSLWIARYREAARAELGRRMA